MLFGMLDDQEKTLPDGSSAYLLAPVCAGASRRCCDATQTDRCRTSRILRAGQGMLGSGVASSNGECVEGRDEATRDEGSSRHTDNAELNGEQKAKELQNNPAAAFVTIDVAYGDRNTDETGRRFRTEVPSTLNRTEMPGSRKMCVWCGRHQDGKEKNTGTEKRQNRTRAGQRKVYSRQETVVYFPKSDKELTNRG